MENAERSRGRPLGTRVWRDLARLAAEGLAIGVFVSLILALAVFVVSMQAPAGDSVRAPRASLVSPDRDYV